ncbi:MAG TPA: c-type cytochrome [Mucilaginibacter sp.]|nr:c-type cytochrome [Mucilaginibacter sp.]
MKRSLKWISAIILVILILTIIAGIYLKTSLPDVGSPENIKVELTPKRVERGKYLANSVMNCMGCHSAHAGNLFAFPDIPDSLGSGGDAYDKSIGYPGLAYVPNITPFNLKNWTDGELFRAITMGVRKDGTVLYPLMPWRNFSNMSREDVYAIIAYLRTLKPIERAYPARKLDFPQNFLVNTYPQKASLSGPPDMRDTVKYGAYLVAMADCAFCHTVKKGMDFAGGYDFPISAFMHVHSANITPDKATGIGLWTKSMFVSRFTLYADSARKPWKVKNGEFQTMMPWWNYGGMSKTDLEAIYSYLRTVKPVKNTVVKFTVNKGQQVASN